MERYIHDSLVAGIIRPSSSPAGVGFFFVEKRDGSLCPCIDYRELNDITVKNHYPLPLMSSAFELLQGASLQSWTSAVLITWFGLGRGTNGRPPLKPIPGILNTWSCRLAFQTPRRSSRHSSTTCSETLSIGFCLFT